MSRLLLLNFTCVIALFLLSSCANPPSSAGKTTAALPQAQDRSIQRLETIMLGGQPQVISIRGNDDTNPVLLFLHGGPGIPEMPVAHLNRGLQRDFTVVHWDQRGAGKSYHKDIPMDSMTIDQFIQDTLELSRYLTTRFQQKKIYLAGFSFGSLVGIQAAAKSPELYHAYVGISQFVDIPESEKILDTRIRRLAKEQKNKTALQYLAKTNPPPYPDHDVETRINDIAAGLVRDKINQPIGIKQYAMIALGSDDYCLHELFGILKGSKFSKLALEDMLYTVDVRKHVSRVDVPVYFLAGKYDTILSPELMKRFHDNLKAPRGKTFIEFPHSDHALHMGNPAAFQAAMRQVLTETFQR
ncbi:putative aminopeptidase YbaC [Oceaniferula spumae]|uniref:Aminopeptidase YbaC n=1 Tax=Oceaniferula spumae TaxID=2979115 RepID=A0AAT9FQI5_9BACT